MELRIYAVLAGAAGTVLVASLLVFAGYRAGQQDVQSEWDKIELERTDAIVSLAQRYADADAEATRLRTRAQALASQRVKEAQDEADTLPVRLECGHNDDEYRLLLDTFCVRNASDPQCL